MSATFKSFLQGALGLIALFIIVSRSGGFAKSVTAGTNGLATDFKILQGRG
jgi:hypothetical protein